MKRLTDLIDGTTPVGDVFDKLCVGKARREVMIGNLMDSCGTIDDAFRHALEETIADGAGDIQNAGCFIVSICIDYESLRTIIHVVGYREVAHAVICLMLADYRPAPFHRQIDGYPDKWGWFLPSGFVSWILPATVGSEEWGASVMRVVASTMHDCSGM